MSKEDTAKFWALDAESTQLKDDLAALQRTEDMAAELGRTTRPPNDAVGGQSDADKAKAEEEKYHACWRNYLKFGSQQSELERGISDEQRSVLMTRRQVIEKRATGDFGEGGPPFGAYPGSTTGFFVPVGFQKRIEEALKWYGGMMGGGPDDPEIMETSTGQPLPFPTDNDTGTTGELVGEAQQVGVADLVVSQIMLGAFKFSTKRCNVSLELLQDSAFDIENFLVGRFAIRLGRILNTKFTTGVGTTEPYGILTQATLGLGSGTTPAIIGDDNQTTPDPTSQVGWLDLTNLEHSVDIAYRKGAKYMMHDQTVRYLKTLKDKYGRLLWAPGVSAAQPDTINGFPYIPNNDMPQIGYGGSPVAGNKSILFGALSKYVIRRVKDLSIVRLVERYAELGQVSFIGFARYDGNLLDAGTHPVKYLQNAH